MAFLLGSPSNYCGLRLLVSSAPVLLTYPEIALVARGRCPKRSARAVAQNPWAVSLLKSRMCGLPIWHPTRWRWPRWCSR